jgi:hypothetical protein
MLEAEEEVVVVELTVHNPVAELNAKPTPRAPRLASLEGVDFGLWWNKKIGGELAVQWLGQQFAEEFGVINHQYYDSFPAHKGMTDRAAEGSRAVVGATGD